MNAVAYGVLRDASGYRTHRQTVTSDSNKWHRPRYHVPGNDQMTVTACGLPAAEFTAERVEKIPERLRCERPACKKRWPDAQATSRGQA